MVFKVVSGLAPHTFAPCETMPRKFQLHPELSPEEESWVSKTGNARTEFGVGHDLPTKFCDEVERWMLPRKDVVYSYVRGLV